MSITLELDIDVDDIVRGCSTSREREYLLKKIAPKNDRVGNT